MHPLWLEPLPDSPLQHTLRLQLGLVPLLSRRPGLVFVLEQLPQRPL
jgi:hypothetical protein